jgi:hypothetical protein
MRGATLDGHINPTDGGPLRVNDGEGFALGMVDSLTSMVCDTTTRGALVGLRGASGIDDAIYRCTYDGSSAYAWRQVAHLPADPGADRLLGWDDSDGEVAYVTAPSFSDYTNAQHPHTSAATGGVLGPLAFGTIGIYQDENYTGTNNNTAQQTFSTTAAPNGELTLAASTAYRMAGVFHIESTGTNSATLSILFAGTATLTSIGYARHFTAPATETTGSTSSGWSTVATATTLGGAIAAARHYSVIVDGTVRSNGAGTFIPQYIFSAAPGVAPVTLANSYFELVPLGASTVDGLGAVS